MGTIRWQAYNKGEQQQKCMIYTYETIYDIRVYILHIHMYTY